MKVYYNGVTLGVVQVVEDSKTAEYDPTGQDYLWTRYRLAVEAIYNPDDPTFAVAYSTAQTGANGRPKPDESPVPSKSASAVYTDVALRHTLMQPRGELIVAYNSNPDPKAVGDASQQVWLESPPTSTGQYRGFRNDPDRLPCDLTNGPLPQEDTIVRAIGDGRTFFVRFVIETCLNDCLDDATTLRASPSNLPVPPLLSNRWTASMSYDDGGYATRTFTGLAIFRADVLRDAQAENDPYWVPDAWRLAILPPVPVNAKRFLDEITQSPDGFTYKYVVRDVEQEVTYLDQPTQIDPQTGRAGFDTTRSPRGVRDISCEVFRQFQSVGTRDALPQFVNNLQQVAWGAREAATVLGESIPGKADDLLFNAGAAVIGGVLTFATTVNNLLPTYSEVVVCTVQGTRNSTKAELFRLAYSCAFGQLSNPIGTATQNAVAKAGQILSQGAGLPGLADAIRATNDMVRQVFRLIPPATTLSVRYDAFKKRVQVTVGQEFGGLLDWATGSLAGGLQAVTRAPQEQVVGGTWPPYLNTLAVADDPLLSAAAGTLLGIPRVWANVTQSFPVLQDDKNLLGTTQDGPGLDLPLAAPLPAPVQPPTAPLPTKPPPYHPARQGTQLFNVIAASLLDECTVPTSYGRPTGEPRYPQDRTQTDGQAQKPPAP